MAVKERATRVQEWDKRLGRSSEGRVAHPAAATTLTPPGPCLPLACVSPHSGSRTHSPSPLTEPALACLIFLPLIMENRFQILIRFSVSAASRDMPVHEECLLAITTWRGKV